MQLDILKHVTASGFHEMVKSLSNAGLLIISEHEDSASVEAGVKLDDVECHKKHKRLF
jgi:hypothetical protein